MWFEIWVFSIKEMNATKQKAALWFPDHAQKRSINADFWSGKTCILDTGRNFWPTQVFFCLIRFIHFSTHFLIQLSHFSIFFFLVRTDISLWLSIFLLLFCAQCPINFAFSKNVLAHWICVWSFLAFVQCVLQFCGNSNGSSSSSGPRTQFMCAKGKCVCVCAWNKFWSKQNSSREWDFRFCKKLFAIIHANTPIMILLGYGSERRSP